MRKQFIFGLVILAILTLWGASWYFIPLMYSKEELEAGTFGDMFGAVNALFSGLAFAGLIYTITVQRQELTLQREAIIMQTEELRMQREETARSADQLENQRKLTNLQIAINTVHELIQVKNKKVESIGYSQRDRDNVKDYYGLDAIKKICSDHLQGKNLIREDSPALQGLLNTFFFTLQYIMDSDLDPSEKLTLAGLVNIEITDVELYLFCHATIENQHKSGLLYNLKFTERFKRLDATWSK